MTPTPEIAPKNAGAFYRAVWRWHFYAGLVTAPLAIWLAITGAIYLWMPQYEAWRYRDLTHVRALYTMPVGGAAVGVPLRVAADTQFATALATHPGARPVTFTPSFAPGRASETLLRLPEGDTVTVFVHPHLGTVVGERRESERLKATIHDLHGELLAGRPGQIIVELGASWLFVLLLTGLYLWWPRPKFSAWGFLLPRLRAKGRVFWRDVHAVPAVWASVGALFLLATGIPWTAVGGAWFKKVSAMLGEGTPRESNASAHRSELTGWSPPLRAGLAEEIEALASAPPPPPPPAPAGRVMIHGEEGEMIWVERDDPRARPVPIPGVTSPAAEEVGRGLRSAPSAELTDAAGNGSEQSDINGAAGNGVPALPPPPPRRGPPDPASLEWCGTLVPGGKTYPISLERVMTLAAQQNVPQPYAIAPPLTETAVFSVLSDRNQAFTRTYLHLDQYSGKVLADVRYRDFGLLGKFVLWGIVAHEGQLFGIANQILGTLAALGVLYMAASALALWWQRRPLAGWSAPPRAGSLPRTVVIGTMALAALLPLLAISFVAFWLLDSLLARRNRNL